MKSLFLSCFLMCCGLASLSARETTNPLLAKHEAFFLELEEKLSVWVWQPQERESVRSWLEAVPTHIEELKTHYILSDLQADRKQLALLLENYKQGMQSQNTIIDSLLAWNSRSIQNPKLGEQLILLDEASNLVNQILLMLHIEEDYEDPLAVFASEDLLQNELVELRNKLCLSLKS